MLKSTEVRKWNCENDENAKMELGKIMKARKLNILRKVEPNTPTTGPRKPEELP